MQLLVYIPSRGMESASPEAKRTQLCIHVCIHYIRYMAKTCPKDRQCRLRMACNLQIVDNSTKGKKIKTSGISVTSIKCTRGILDCWYIMVIGNLIGCS